MMIRYYNNLCYAEPNSEGGKLLEKLGVIARERWFMLSIKAKFAGKNKFINQ